jgi:Domain of unknown function (DUF4920)
MINFALNLHNMRIFFYSLSLTALLFTACTDKTSKTAAYDKMTENRNSASAFGSTFKPKSALTVDQLTQKMSATDKMSDVVVKGQVLEVCQTKGCWMTLKNEATGSELFVKFKDYGFFVPKDMGGKQVAMKGEAFYLVTSVEDLKQELKEAGKPQSEIDAVTKPHSELRFLASGVQIL